MENINKLLLQNVLPFHVASFFMGKAIRNQVTPKKKGHQTKYTFSLGLSVPGSGARMSCMLHHIPSVCFRTCTVSHMTVCV